MIRESLKKKFKIGDKVFFNSRFKLFGKRKLQFKWDGPYIVHDVSPAGAVTIMDLEVNTFMVNGQRLKVSLEGDKFEVNYIDTYEFKEVRIHYHGHTL